MTRFTKKDVDNRRTYFIREFEGTEGIYLRDVSNGIILNKKEMEDLVKGLQLTILHYDKTDIDGYNEEITLEVQKALEKHNSEHRASQK